MKFEPSRFTTHVGRLFQEARNLPHRGLQHAERFDGSGGGYAAPMRPSPNGGRPSGPMTYLHARPPPAAQSIGKRYSASPGKITANRLFGRPPALHTKAGPVAINRDRAGSAERQREQQ